MTHTPPMIPTTTLPLPESSTQTAAEAIAPADRCAGLDGLALIRIDGADAAAFLQSQFTSDVEALAPDRWHWTGYCSPKGRLLAIGRLARDGAAFHLEVPVELRDDLLTRLRRFVMRSKVVLSPVAPGWRVVALVGQGAIAAAAQKLGPGIAEDQAALTGDAAVLLAVGAERAHLYFDAAAMPGLAAVTGALSVDAAAADWQSVDLRAGIPWIVPATQDTFVPQMVDLDVIGGVSFAKGCYPGQEIVARSRYLGEVKRRLHFCRSGGLAEAGAAIDAAGQGVGKVLASRPSDGGQHDILAVIDSEAAKGADLMIAGAPVHEVRRARPPVANG